LPLKTALARMGQPREQAGAEEGEVFSLRRKLWYNEKNLCGYLQCT
jgi:hypothetical protein